MFGTAVISNGQVGLGNFAKLILKLEHVFTVLIAINTFLVIVALEKCFLYFLLCTNCQKV